MKTEVMAAGNVALPSEEKFTFFSICAADYGDSIVSSYN